MISGKEYEIQFESEDDDKLNEIHNASIDNGQKKKTKSLAEKAGLYPRIKGYIQQLVFHS